MSHSVTLDLPDNLYRNLQQRNQQTNRPLEEELLTAFALNLPAPLSMERLEDGVHGEVMGFLGSGPSTKEITQFQLSSEASGRASELMAQERERELTEAETRELDFYVELGDFLGLLRAKALLHLNKQANAS